MAVLDGCWWNVNDDEYLNKVFCGSFWMFIKVKGLSILINLDLNWLGLLETVQSFQVKELLSIFQSSICLAMQLGSIKCSSEALFRVSWFLEDDIRNAAAFVIYSDIYSHLNG